MNFQRSTTILTGACALALSAGVFTAMNAQPPQGGRGGGGRGGAAVNVFTAADADKDGFITRDELRSAFPADNLKQYDFIFLIRATGAFLDDPTDSGTTAARKKALLDFVRSGKGLAGVHAAGDSYHEARGAAAAPAATAFGGRGPGSQ